MINMKEKLSTFQIISKKNMYWCFFDILCICINLYIIFTNALDIENKLILYVVNAYFIFSICFLVVIIIKGIKERRFFEFMTKEKKIMYMLRAIHESGHVICIKKLKDEKCITKVSILKNGKSGGSVSISYKKSDLTELEFIYVLLSGVLSEIIITDCHIYGSESGDIKDAVRFARKILNINQEGDKEVNYTITVCDNKIPVKLYVNNMEESTEIMQLLINSIQHTKNIIDGNKKLVLHLSMELFFKKEITGKKLKKFLDNSEKVKES